MRGQIKEVLSNLSKATVIVTHDQLEALTMADRIAIMRDGMIEQVGTPHEVFAKPANVFVASFIGTPQMNLMEADLKSFDKGVASVTLAGNAVEMAADPAVSTLKPSKVMIGIRPRAFTAERSPARTPSMPRQNSSNPWAQKPSFTPAPNWAATFASSCRAPSASRLAKCCI